MRILVVDDDDELRGLLVELLEEHRYAVDAAADGASASELAAVNPYDLIVLDWSLPVRSGMELLSGWRGQGLQTPVLMLTAHRGVGERVDGLDAGADDYLTKPFSLEELLARIRSLLRRRERTISPLSVGNLTLDPVRKQVRVGGQPVELSPREYAVLEYLLSRVDEVVTRTEISEHAWDDSFDAMSNVIDVTIYRLRRKIDGGRSPGLLHTVKGHGYVLKSDPSPSP